MNRATKERWVYSVPGYSPSEPGFVKNPLTEDEDDGIVMAVMSPLADYDLRYLLLEVSSISITFQTVSYHVGRTNFNIQSSCLLP